MPAWLDLTTAKISVAVTLLCGTLLFAAIPVVLSRRSSNHQSSVRHVLTGLSSLGGGVFLGTCFLHLLPDAVEEMSEAMQETGLKTHNLPLAYVLVIAGFVLVLICEQFSHMLNKGNIIDLGHPQGSQDTAVPVPDYGAIRRNAELDHGVEHSDGVDNSLEDSDDEDRMTTVSVHGDPGSHSPFRALVLVLALSLHSVFEGITIGLADTTTIVFELLGVIAVHKGVIAVILATSLVSKSTKLKPWWVIVALVIFSSMAPLGIIFTFLIDKSQPMLSAVLQCIAVGTFVYITFLEILPHELNSKSTHGSRWFKVLMLLLGIGTMMVLITYFPDHGHGNKAPSSDNSTTSPTTTVAPEINTTLLG